MKRALILSLLILTSCGMRGTSDDGIRVLDAASIVAGQGPETDRAEKLAKVADKLLSTGAMKPAMDVAEVALELDPTNARAGLIMSIGKPMTQLRGFMTRLVNYNGTWTNSYYTTIRTMLSNSANQHASYYRKSARFEDFLFEQVSASDYPAFTSEKSLQDELDGVVQSFDDLRHFAKDHRDTKMAISAASTMIPMLVDRYASACNVVEDTKLVYRLECPADVDTSLVILDRADFEMLADVASYYEFALTVFNAYDLTGLSKADLPKNYGYSSYSMASTANAETTISSLMNQAGFGKLRTTNKLSALKDLTLDIVSGLNWAIANQSTICFNNDASRINHVFDSGLCLQGMSSSFLKPITDAAAGKVVQVSTAAGGTTDFKPLAFLDHPLSDLHNLGTLKFNADHELIAVDEQTLGGMFPKADFNSTLAVPTPATVTPKLSK